MSIAINDTNHSNEHMTTIWQIYSFGLLWIAYDN